ncbi:AAA family ATPase [Sansalvadorimonas verongulae]|uniref:AAA family ATPase n=1 Tax=Sansalvadorimonas verongulae TaxID=2172824 RepID=UPI0018AD2446|nr:AAA family ATPase [Sansalvadorimonas verongulae]
MEPGKKKPSYAYEHYLGNGQYLYVKRSVRKAPLVMHPSCIEKRSSIVMVEDIEVQWDPPVKNSSYRTYPRYNNSETEYGLAAEVLSLDGLKQLVQILTGDAVPASDQEREDDVVAVISEDTGYTPPLNQILYGPPGTGKTYHTAIEALKVLEPAFLETSPDYKAIRERYEQFQKEGRIAFVTFHQSFSYEDFVEGIKAETEDGKVQYTLEDGVFKRICNLASAKVMSSEGDLEGDKDRRVWKLSLGNTLGEEDFVYEECIKNGYSLLGWGGNIDFNYCESPAEIRDAYIKHGDDQTEGSYAVTAVNTFKNSIRQGDLIIASDGNQKFRAIGEVTGDYFLLDPTEPRSGYLQCRKTRWLRVYEPSRPVDELCNKQFSQRSLYELKSHVLKRNVLVQLLSANTKEENKDYVIVIDEINRGNISRIFGELITLLEPGKRAGASEALSVILPYSKEDFSVPNNLYVIGTMNTADRSLAQLDIALRRRFEFIEMMPDASLLKDVTVAGVSMERLLLILNERIEVLLDRDHTLGHSYFLPLAEEGANTLENLGRIFQKQIIPLLQEYFFEDWQRIQWVLNDHLKPKKYQFIHKGGKTDLDSLFGHEVSGLVNDRRWSLNSDALGESKSYATTIRVLETEDSAEESVV